MFDSRDEYYLASGQVILLVEQIVLACEYQTRRYRKPCTIVCDDLFALIVSPNGIDYSDAIIEFQGKEVDFLRFSLSQYILILILLLNFIVVDCLRGNGLVALGLGLRLKCLRLCGMPFLAFVLYNLISFHLLMPILNIVIVLLFLNIVGRCGSDLMRQGVCKLLWALIRLFLLDIMGLLARLIQLLLLVIIFFFSHILLILLNRQMPSVNRKK